ncbi:uncharacterized protein LOC143887177 [Tasmannia lanceolata]|uniref:uncharacterized protein LOC143887177 n=1 Tax=Tasmannia lanceolata TaxID=3420 RepID=UPI0040648BBD
MGREWYWSRSMRRGDRESPGCMSGVLNLFDFHQSQCISQQEGQRSGSKTDDSFLLEPIVKGVEAPRNSLELQNDPSSSVIEVGIPIGVRLVPRTEVEESSSSSQGSRTPNLLARLMGLDILPDESTRLSPSPVKARQPLKDINFVESTRYESGSRSLPDTPRISSARRSDVDPRLSLQLNKENMEISEFNYSRKARKKDGKYYYEENKSPSKYAREIVKQVKENIGRKVGVDITNVSRKKGNTESETKRVSTRHKDESTHSTQSCSPRIRILESKARFSVPEEPISNSPKFTSKAQQMPLKDSTKASSQQPLGRTFKCKKANSERFTGRLKKPPLNEETFVVPKSTLSKKKCKETSSTPIHPPSTQKPIEQQQQQQGGVPSKPTPPLPNSSRPLYDPLLFNRDDRTGPEFRYVTLILERTGVHTKTPISITPWFSPSHPLNPSLFHLLERSGAHNNDLPKPNRKLLFQLVDQLLVKILKPYLNLKPWVPLWVRTPPRQLTGAHLLDLIWAHITSFPSANCQTLQDIDALVGHDLLECADSANVRTRTCCSGFYDEREEIVVEIERDILDALLREVFMGSVASDGSMGIFMMRGSVGI